MRTGKQIWVNKKAWEKVRNMFPGIPDSKRSIIITTIVQETDVARKLNPENSDSKRDKIMKKLMKRMMYGF